MHGATIKKTLAVLLLGVLAKKDEGNSILYNITPKAALKQYTKLGKYKLEKQ